MNKKIGKILGVILLVILIVIAIAAAVFCIRGKSRYTRELQAVEGDSDIDISENWFSRTFLNCQYRSRISTFKKELASGENVSVLFLGDSITEYMDEKIYYPEYESINFGIAGDTTRGILNRMDLIYEANPETIVLLIGINDMMNEGRKPENVIISYEQILKELKENLPETRIICQSVYPTYDGTDYKCAYLKNDIIELNSMIKKLTDEYELEYCDTYSVLVDNDGLMNEKYSKDGVHPVDAGYLAASDYVKNVLSK